MHGKRRLRAHDDGFTLVELIVVIGIIGILAAIAAPTYLSLQDTVRQAGTKSDLANDRTALVAWGIDNNGAVPAVSGFAPGSNGLNLVGYGWTQGSESPSYRYYTNTAATLWCLEMTNSTSVVYRVSPKNAAEPGTCSALGAANY